jgi:hypothetical protein
MCACGVRPSQQCGLSFELAFDILRHADVKDSARAACACKALHDLQSSDMWWKRATHRLGAEARLYVSATAAGAPITGGTWRDEFFRLWACRDRWVEPAVEEAERVRDRFRQMVTAGEESQQHEDAAEEVSSASASASAEEQPTAAATYSNAAYADADAEAEAEAATAATAATAAAAVEAAPAAAVEAERGSIKVCVRMRPRGSNAPRAGPASDDGHKGVVLPLHQRLQIIKAQQGGAVQVESSWHPAGP